MFSRISNCVFFKQIVFKIKEQFICIIHFDSSMKIKANDKFHGKNSGFVDSGFVKTCDELVIGLV